MLDTRKYREIYEYCQKQYEKLEKDDGCYSPKHDKIVMGLASKHFRMSEKAVEQAFDLAVQKLPEIKTGKKIYKMSYNA